MYMTEKDEECQGLLYVEGQIINRFAVFQSTHFMHSYAENISIFASIGDDDYSISITGWIDTDLIHVLKVTSVG